MKLTFVICTYNPDQTLLIRVIESIQSQVGVKAEEIEILVIDNRSSLPVESYLSHIPNIRVIRENKPGLTNARICGTKNSSAPVLIFVDDDNILDKNYAKTTLILIEQHPAIGVFTAGRILPEYQCPPPNNIGDYWPYMALIDQPHEKWANFMGAKVLPIGAGMVVRQAVMERYREIIRNTPDNANIDRDGQALMAGGDTDIGIASFDLGLGCGYFPQLQLTHYMPAFRLQQPYLNRLVRDVSYSTWLVEYRASPSSISLKNITKLGIRTLLKFLAGLGTNKPENISSISRLKAAVQVWKTQKSKSHCPP